MKWRSPLFQIHHSNEVVENLCVSEWCFVDPWLQRYQWFCPHNRGCCRTTMTGCVRKQNQRRCVRKPNRQQWLGPVSEEKRSAGYNVHQSLRLLACWMHRQSNRIHVVSLCLITFVVPTGVWGWSSTKLSPDRHERGGSEDSRSSRDA